MAVKSFEHFYLFFMRKLKNTFELKIDNKESIKDCRLDLGNPMDMPAFLVLHYLAEFAQILSIELVMPPNYLILCHPLLFLP